MGGVHLLDLELREPAATKTFVPACPLGASSHVYMILLTWTSKVSKIMAIHTLCVKHKGYYVGYFKRPR